MAQLQIQGVNASLSILLIGFQGKHIGGKYKLSERAFNSSYWIRTVEIKHKDHGITTFNSSYWIHGVRSLVETELLNLSFNSSYWILGGVVVVVVTCKSLSILLIGFGGVELLVLKCKDL